MQVAVKTPHIDVKIAGTIPKRIMKALREEYGNDLVITQGDDELLDIETTDWFQEIEQEITPGVTLKTYRKREGLSQGELGKLLGDVPKQNISGMERGERPIGKAMAKRLATALHFNYKVLL